MDEIRISFSESEKEFIEPVMFYLDTDLEKKFEYMVFRDGRYSLCFSPEELESFIEYVCAEANHCENSKTRDRLDELTGRLEEYLE